MIDGPDPDLDLEDVPDRDPYLLTLGQIAAELTAIRQELQKLTTEPEQETGETFECRCGYVAESETEAQQHAGEHNAPPGVWRELYI